MLILRIVLFLGLVFHKFVWEALKRGKGRVSNKEYASPSLLKAFVKLGKSAVLIFIMIQTLFLDLLPIVEDPIYLRFIGTALFFAGLTIAIVGRLQLGENWANLEDYQVLQKQSLVTTGLYAFIRHPIYAGDILLLIGLELALNSWLVLCALLPLLVVIKQTTAEEELLAYTFSGYTDYRKRTKRFIPFVV